VDSITIHNCEAVFVQEVFADVKDDDDDEFEIVPLKPSKSADDISDGLYCVYSVQMYLRCDFCVKLCGRLS